MPSPNREGKFKGTGRATIAEGHDLFLLSVLGNSIDLGRSQVNGAHTSPIAVNGTLD
jgi:hypothetical protein